MLRFENNTLSSFEYGAIMFNTTGLDVSVARVMLDMPCDCAALDTWGRDLLNEPRYPAPALLPAVAPETLFCRPRADRLGGLGTGLGTGGGAGGGGSGGYVTVKDFKEHSCGFFSFNLDVLIIVAAALGVAVIALLVLVVICCRRRARRRRKRRWDGKGQATANGTNGAHRGMGIGPPTVIMDISDDKEVEEALRRKSGRHKPGTQFKRVIQPSAEEERHMLKQAKQGKGQAKGQGPFTLVVPDGRVYRETELHVIVERAEPLRELRELREREREPLQEPGG